MGRRCLVVLGMFVCVLEGTVVTTVSQREASSAPPTTLTTAELTTVSTTNMMSARPTTLLRRIDVQKEDYNTQHTPDIFFRRSARKSRRYLGPFDQLWIWDYWCMLQPETGNCGRNNTKYYYNTQVDQCLTHLFSGCSTKNNRNQFDSIEECENHCKGSSLMPVNLPQNTDICKLQPITGRCLGQIQMFYYDINENACKTFIYGGCAGNGNNFQREMQCLVKCGTSKSFNYTEDIQMMQLEQMMNPTLTIRPDDSLHPDYTRR